MPEGKRYLTMRDRALRSGGLTGGHSANAAVGKRITLRSAGGSPKSTDGGKDLSKNATNVLSGTQVSQEMYAPGPKARRHYA